MAEVRIYYPSDKIQLTEMDELADEFYALDGVEGVYPIGRRGGALDWAEFEVALAFVSGFVADKFFGELIKEAAKFTCKGICDKLVQLKRERLKGGPMAISVEMGVGGTEISFRLDTDSMDHLQAALSAAPGLLAELLKSDWPPAVCSIRADLAADSGEFECAVGWENHSQQRGPSHVYDFAQKKWIPVSR